MLNQESVFKRTTGSDTMSRNAYNLLMGVVLLWGFAINWLLVTNVPVESLLSINKWVFLGGYFASCLIGIFMMAKSSNPMISFIGYNFIVVPFGLVLNMVLYNIAPDIIQSAIQTTALVTFSMMVLGTLFPKFFESISGALFWSLLIVIVVEVVQSMFFNTHSGILDWIVAFIFCGYIGVDWGRANRIPKTADNAIDSAAALYMDIIILFMRIVQIFARNK